MEIVPQNHLTRTKPRLSGGARAIGISVGLLACSLSSPLAAQDVVARQVISVVVAQTGDVVRKVRATGTVVPKNAIALRADLDGLRLTAVEAEAGDLVEAGDILARLDDTMLRAEERELSARLLRTDAAISQARNGVDDTDIALAQAEADMRRSGSLQRQGFASSQAAEVLETALKRARTARATAAQALQLAIIDRQVAEAESAHLSTRLAKTLVRAPVAGRVLERVATVGMLVANGGQPLFTLAENAVLEVEADLSERDFALVGVAQTSDLWVAGRTDPVRGTIRLVLPQLANGTRLGRVRIALPPETSLPAGAFVRGDVEVSHQEGIVVPASAVSTDGTASSLWRERDGSVERIQVEAGVRAGNVVHVVSGLEEGARVVLKAGSLLSQGDRIAPVEVAYDVPSRPSSMLQSARTDR